MHVSGTGRLSGCLDHQLQQQTLAHSSTAYGRRPVASFPTRFRLHQRKHSFQHQNSAKRQHCSRHKHLRTSAASQAEQAAPTPPKPNAKFSRKDLRRIKQHGPSEADLQEPYSYETKDNHGTVTVHNEHFIPAEVLGSVNYEFEPNWRSLPQMPYMEFYHGLRQRNWTSPYHDPTAPAWDLKFYKDSGRLLRASYPGYRVLVIKDDGTHCWVNLPTAGAETFTKDYMSAEMPGSDQQLIEMREPQPNVTMYQYGYNQVFQQLFQAYEQKLPKAAKREFDEQGALSGASAHKYSCPGEAIGVSFNMTPQEATLAPLWNMVPAIAFFSFAFSFLAVCLGLGIFRPRKMMPSDPIQAMEFAQSKGQAHKEGRTGITLADVAGLDPIVGRLQQVVTYLRDPQGTQFTGLARPPKGVLLEGDPGVGKTLIAKAIAGEAGVPFFQMSGSEFVEAIVGVGAARVRDLFKRARAQKEPCIIFVDEIDALGIKRAEAGMRTNEEREQTLNQLLTEMDGFIPGSGVVFMAATNRADLLDNALTRPGRFDWRVLIAKPDQEAREAILKVHTRKRPMADDVNLAQIAQDLPGLSGAELANVINEAALTAVRRNGNTITMADIYDAMDRVLQGVRRPALPDYLHVKKAFAVHECGKAMVATALRQQTGRMEQVERVSIVPRGRGWTRTTFLRGEDEEYTLAARGRMMERLQVILAGRAAEEVTFDMPTTYSMPDLRDASRLAVKIVSNYGLSDAGITTYAAPGHAMGFMQKSFEVAVDNIDQDLFRVGIRGGSFQPSDDTLHAIKSKAYSLLTDAYQKDLMVLRQNSEALKHASDSILTKETLTGDELADFMTQYPPQQPAETNDQSSVTASKEYVSIFSPENADMLEKHKWPTRL